MKNIVTVSIKSKKDKTIVTELNTTGKWQDFILEDFFATYDHDVSRVPDQIALIPVLCNLLPIAWLYDLEISVDSIDKNFLAAIPKMKKGYQKMYPKLKFDGKISYDKVIDTKYNAKKQAVFFSGGVDAVTTYLRNADQRPDLITVFGADINLSDEKGIKTVNKQHAEFAKTHHIGYERIFTNFRSFIDERELEQPFKQFDYGWWHEFQHGIGLIGLAAPISYVNGYKNIYIAASFNTSLIGKYTCASDPTIDNQLKYGSTKTTHDGFELNRQEKIKYICGYQEKTEKPVSVRVCWESDGGKNCGHCEKCRRTILAIIAEKKDPKLFGFNFDDRQYHNMIKFYKTRLQYNIFVNQLAEYRDIQKAYIDNYTLAETPPEMRWFRNIKIGAKDGKFIVFKDRAKNFSRKLIRHPISSIKSIAGRTVLGS